MKSSLPVAVPAIPRPQSAHRPGQNPQPTRRYQVSALCPDGSVTHSFHVAPAGPRFEAAFSAFARGTLITTPNGPVAVEDLCPGEAVTTQTGGTAKLIWRGAMTHFAESRSTRTTESHLIRVPPDSFGIGSPLSGLLCGAGARLLQRPKDQLHGSSDAKILIPLRDLIDGFNVFEVRPPSPVSVYHLCLERHAILSADGLPMESFHPAGLGFQGAGQTFRALFMSLFPNMQNLEDFGPLACPRTSASPGRS